MKLIFREETPPLRAGLGAAGGVFGNMGWDVSFGKQTLSTEGYPLTVNLVWQYRLS